MSLFENALCVAVEDIELKLAGQSPLAWAEFWLNPRRLRGSDFLMRWSQGVWSERRIIQAVNDSHDFYALPYGPSGTAPDNDPRAVELYFERLEQAGLGKVKRPDLLIFHKQDEAIISGIVHTLGGVSELPFVREDDPAMQDLLARAVVAVECENSLWKAQQMPDYGAELKPQKRLGGKMGLKKGAVLPTIIIKEEDRAPLREWQTQRRIKIHIWHLFYDTAFGIAFDRAEDLIEQGFILPEEQTYQAPGGATSKKITYRIYHHYSYPLSDTEKEPTLVAAHIIDKNGHILPYVRFEGGKMLLKSEAMEVLREISGAPQ
jgi:hypothetical protein